MGGKTSKGSTGSTSSSHPTLNRSGSAIAHAAHSLPPHKAAAVEAKLQTLDHIYSGIAACVILSNYGRGLDAAASTEIQRSLEESDVHCLHIYGALRCFSCFRMDERFFLVFFTAPAEQTPRSSTSGAARAQSAVHHTAAQDEKVKQLCIELRQVVADGSEETEAEAAHQFASFSTDVRASAPKTPRRAGRPSEGHLSSDSAVRTPSRDEQIARAERATPSKDERKASISSLTRPTAASLLRQQSASTPVRTPTRSSASITPVKSTLAPSPSIRSTPTRSTPSVRATPTRKPAPVPAPPAANAKSTPSRILSTPRSTPSRAPSVRAPPPTAVAKKPAVPTAPTVSADAKVEPRSDARSLLEARDELQRLMNLLLQAVLANAKASAAAEAQQARAEVELFAEWNQLEVLRKELTVARHKLARDTHTLDLRMLLQTQYEQAVQATAWLPTFQSAYAAFARALEHTTHLMPAPNVAFSPPAVLASFSEAHSSLSALDSASLAASNVPDVSNTVSRLASVLRDEEMELARLQELLTMHAQLENYERSLRIQAIQAAQG